MPMTDDVGELHRTTCFLAIAEVFHLKKCVPFLNDSTSYITQKLPKCMKTDHFNNLLRICNSFCRRNQFVQKILILLTFYVLI